MAPFRTAHRPPGRGLSAVTAVAAGSAAVLLLASCAPIQALEPAPERQNVPAAELEGKTVIEGGDLVMALSAEPDRLDPTTSSSLYTRYVMQTMCQKLYDIDADGQLAPQLATGLPEISADGLTVRIPLRTDAVFADGSPFNAEAAKTTLERHLTLEGSTRRGELGPITGITAAGEFLLEIAYETPFAPLTAALADRAGMMLSPAALEQAGDTFGDHPVCVGPFKFKERVPQTSISVERDPLYYDAGSVHLDSITYRIMTDANIRAANLRSGDVQVADTISPQDVDALVQEEGLGVLQTGSLGYQAMTVNIGNVDGTGEPPGDLGTPLAREADIRRALSMSIDREALVNTVFNSWYEPACSPISPDSPYASDLSEDCVDFDPEAARALLESTGAPVPFPITMQVTNSPDTLRYAQALQAAVSEGGFDLTIRPVEYSTLLDVQTRGDFEALQLGWSGRIDPHGNMSNFLKTGGGNNYSGYSNPEVDRLLTGAAQSTDPDVRAELYGQVVEQVHLDNPILYLYRVRSLTGYTKDVAGVATYPDGVVRLGTAAFVEEEG
ncbi:ABC transporter substrate-binding protein [Arthrobacter sp. ATA002]|uniref:ABC transporter substrate-binding protein n=1 Tax=Arthrobacter sp. ATA002 TaxID=2991715 RepID=UPI0022A70E66|nr:ABC transporter substrate-binding protein [Arthrobacter sp. ATA002]WAP51340.1 ABC transporter substrate-binding protein [Arthrobacter sp. ATA002]